MTDLARMPTDDYEGVFREPNDGDYYLAWVVLLLGIAAVACELLLPWAFDDPSASPRPKLPFYIMAFVGPSVGILGIIFHTALRRRFRKIRPETTPRTMMGAGLVCSFVPVAVGVATIIAWGMASGR